MRGAIGGLIPLLFLWIMSSVAGAGDGFFPFEYREVELENGFKAFLIQAEGSGQIAYVTVVRTGSREEWEPGRSGYAHFFEHMMFRGTKRYPHFDKVLTPLGADHNAFTSSDMTVYYIVASSASLEQIVDLESDRFRNLDYSESDFQIEAGAVLGEFNQGKASPYRALYEKLRETAFDRHTYRHTTIGFEEDVRNMPGGYEYSRTFFRRYYRPENCVLILAGDFDTEKAEALIRKSYAPWEKGYVAPQIQEEPAQEAPREATVEFPGRTSPLYVVSYKGPAWKADDRMAVAATALGELAFGRNSEIYRRLVLEEQVAQSLSGDFDLLRDPYLLSITARVESQEKIAAVQKAISETIALYQDELCDQTRLDAVKRALRYDFLMGLETAQGIAFSLIEVAVNTGEIGPVEEYFKTLGSISPEDIRAAARKFLVEEGRTTVTLVPQKEGQ